MTIDDILNLNDRAEAYYEIVNLFMSGSDDTRHFILKNWDFNAKWRYPNPYKLACKKNEMKSPTERIKASCFSLLASWSHIDIRDWLVAIAVIYHSIIEAGMDPNVELRKVIAVSPSDIGGEINRFLLRASADRSLEALLLLRVKTMTMKSRSGRRICLRVNIMDNNYWPNGRPGRST